MSLTDPGDAFEAMLLARAGDGAAARAAMDREPPAVPVTDFPQHAEAPPLTARLTDNDLSAALVARMEADAAYRGLLPPPGTEPAPGDLFAALMAGITNPTTRGANE